MSSTENLKPTKLKLCFLAAIFAFPLCGFAQDKNKPTDKVENRVSVEYKQRHSRTNKSTDLYADGIKIKRDLSLIEKAREERVLDMDEIPADDLYGGLWSNRYVNVYGSLDAAPDTFKVDLSNFTMPTMGYVTSNFGPRRRRMHSGIDLKVQVGDTIYAAFDGKVRICQYERKGYGNYVVLRHPNGLETVYGHLSRFLVDEDAVVRSGEPIALGGNTGRSTGPHLHFEFRFLGKAINPNQIVDFNNKVCHRDTYMVTNKSFVPGSSASAKTYAKSTTGSANKYVSGKVSYHRVKSGDSLYKIAKLYGTTVRSLCKLNGVSEKTRLHLGQSLRIS